MRAMTIGQVAQRSGTGIETVRFYERVGLIQPLRSPSGYRQYQPEAIQRLRFIKRSKELGFSLKEIRELLALKNDPATTCGDVKGQAEAKIADINQRIESLQRMKQALMGLSTACPGGGPTRDCPILAALEIEEAKW